MISSVFKSIHRQVLAVNKKTKEIDLSTLMPDEDAIVSPRFRIESNLACRNYERTIDRLRKMAYAVKYHTNLEFTGDQ